MWQKVVIQWGALAYSINWEKPSWQSQGIQEYKRESGDV